MFQWLIYVINRKRNKTLKLLLSLEKGTQKLKNTKLWIHPGHVFFFFNLTGYISSFPALEETSVRRPAELINTLMC